MCSILANNLLETPSCLSEHTLSSSGLVAYVLRIRAGQGGSFPTLSPHSEVLSPHTRLLPAEHPDVFAFSHSVDRMSLKKKQQYSSEPPIFLLIPDTKSPFHLWVAGPGPAPGQEAVTHPPLCSHVSRFPWAWEERATSSRKSASPSAVPVALSLFSSEALGWFAPLW